MKKIVYTILNVEIKLPFGELVGSYLNQEQRIQIIFPPQQWHCICGKSQGFSVNQYVIIEFEEWSISSIIRVWKSRGGVKSIFIT